MPYCIIETESGWTVEQCQAGSSAEDIAMRLGATLIDPGPYDEYEAAVDALCALQAELAGEHVDTPGTQVLESRSGSDA